MENEIIVSYVKKANSENAEATYYGKRSEICSGISDLINNAIEKDIVSIVELSAIVSFALDCMSKKEHVDKKLLIRTLAVINDF